MTSNTPRQPTLLASASWLIGAKTIGFILTTALPLVLARRLTLAEFGNYKQLFLVLTSAATLLPLGMQMSAFYFFPRAHSVEERGRVACCILMFYAMVTGAAGVCLLLAPQLLTRMLGNSSLGGIGRVIGVAMIFYVTSTVFESVVVANGESQLGAAVIVGSNLMRSCVILVTCVVWGNIQAIAWGTLVYSVVQFSLLLTYMRSRFPGFWKRCEAKRFRDQLSYTIPLGAAGLLWSLQLDLHNYLVSNQFGPVAFAIYSQGVFQLPLIGILADSVLSVLIPRVSVLQQQDARRDIVDLTVNVMRGLALAYLPICMFLSVMAKEVIVFLFTPKFLPSVPIFQVNLLMLPLSVLMVDPVMRSYKEQRFWMFNLNLIMLCVLMLTLKLGIASFGMIGTIGCVVGTQYLSRFILAFHVARFLGLQWQDLLKLLDIVKIAAATGGSGLVIWVVRRATTSSKPFIVLLLAAVSFAACYSTLLLVFRVPNKKELEMLRRRALGVLSPLRN